MKRSVLILTVLTLTAIFLTFSVGQAYAQYDAKNYPGAMGVPLNENDDILRNWSNGTIENRNATSSLYVILPVVKDTIYASINSGRVKAVDRNTDSLLLVDNFNDNVCCYLTRRRMLGNAWQGNTSALRCTTGNSANVQTLSFPALNSTSDSHYFYKCWIPRTQSGVRSSIVSYSVTEKPYNPTY